MKKFATMLMLVCTLGVFAVVGCEGSKTTPAPAAPAKTGDKMESTGDKGKMETPPATPPATPAPADKSK